MGFPNVDFDVNTDVAASDDNWLRVTILRGAGSSFNVSLGPSPMVRTAGIMVAEVRSRDGKGTKRAMELADIIANGFRNVTAAGIRWRVPSIDPVGEDGPWYHVNVWCPFERDETF